MPSSHLQNYEPCMAARIKQLLGILMSFGGVFLGSAQPLNAWASPCQENESHCISKEPSTVAPPPLKKKKPTPLSREEIARLIGWVSSESPLNRCGGYYLEPNLFYNVSPHADLDKNPITITADETELSQQAGSKLQGNVVISQPDREVRSREAYIDRSALTHQLTTVDLFGEVSLREPGKLAMARKAHLNLQDHGATLDDVVYRLNATSRSPMLQYDVPNTLKPTLKIETPTAWGTAKQYVREPSGVLVVHKATYTTCPPLQHRWMVKARKLTLNKETGVGEARDAALFLGPLPVLYAPYFSFPLDDRRKSGLLFPDVGHSSLSGYKLGVPYYFNLAPNYDATLMPEVMTLRGVQLNGLVRYLNEEDFGNFHGSVLPHDRAFSEFKEREFLQLQNSAAPGLLNRLENTRDNRYFVSYQDTRQYGHSGWSSHLWVNQASDDYYFEDFQGDPSQIADNQIINEGELFYTGEHWNFTGRAIGYQTLHPIDLLSPVVNQYRRLPQLILNGNYPGFWKSWSFHLNTEFNEFTYLNAPSQNPLTIPSVGTRFYMEPGVSLPLYGAAGYFKPELKLTAAQYNTTHMNVFFYNSEGMETPGMQGGNISRVLPIADVDMGLIFERSTQWFGHGYHQTLEPRLFLLYVPYTDQNNIPVFDTAVDPFSFQQLFRTNRFTGTDRIGDTQQASLALTSRFLDNQTGDEKLRAGIGEIYYFGTRKVNLNNIAGPVTLASQVSNEARVSPIAGQLIYHLNPFWQFESNIVWNPSDHNELQNISLTKEPNENRFVNGDVSLQYQTDNNHLFMLGYYYLRGGDPLSNQAVQNGTPPIANGDTITSSSSINNLSQGQIGEVWPLGNHWKTYSSMRYDFSKAHPQTFFAGLEYDSCCLATRLTAGREFKNINNQGHFVYDSSLYLEFSLIGLGNVGFSSPARLFQSTFPTYSDRFGNVDYYNS